MAASRLVVRVRIRPEAPTTITIRPAGDADHDHLFGTYAEAHCESLLALPAAEQLIRMQFDAHMRGYREDWAGAVCYVIEAGGQRCGSLWLFSGALELRPLDLSLLKAWRNRGIGSEVLRQLQETATAAGKLLRLRVEHCSPAVRLYQRMGFRTIQVEPTCLHMEWRC